MGFLATSTRRSTPGPRGASTRSSSGSRASRTAHFLERVFHKLLLNFTWWVNRKDTDGHNVFQGGFLGLDNIGVFDRRSPLPVGGHLGQADGTAWMGMYCLYDAPRSRSSSRWRTASTRTSRPSSSSTSCYIAGALNNIGGTGIALWNEEDEFFYDVLHLDTGEVVPLKVRSLVGLIPLLAVETLEPDVLERAARVPAPDGLVPAQPAGPRVARVALGGAGRCASGGCSRWSAAIG